MKVSKYPSGYNQNQVSSRHDEPREAIAAPDDIIARPLPPDGDVPHGERDVTDDVDHSAKDDRRPACPVQERVRDPSISKRADHLHCGCPSGIVVDLRHGVRGTLGILEELCKDGRRTSRVVESSANSC